jgi:CDP-2,3-bis-(O-geranylgeranyl)-sn-glycerol synthase
MHNLLFAIWFFLPGGYANASPVFAAKIPILKKLDFPIDFKKSIKGHRILGDNKTWRGLILAIIVGLVIIAIQIYLYDHFSWIRSISMNVNYSNHNIWLLGPLIGFGVMFGDAIESFFKRQIGIKPGHSWFPFDQIDYIIGGLLFSLPIVILSLYNYFLIIIIWLLIHIISSYIGYLIGLKSKPI